MIDDDLRTRAREAAWDTYPKPWDGRVADRREAFIAGALWHAAQQPGVVCICGSTRFRAEMVEANRRLTMEGSIVLAPGVFGHDGDPMTEADKGRLDALHLRKIDLADRVVVVAPGEYIGSSTSREIEYARAGGKRVEVWTEFPAHVAQQPTREQIARAMHADDLAHDRAADAWEDMSAESHDWYGSNADAVLALFDGTDS